MCIYIYIHSFSLFLSLSIRNIDLFWSGSSQGVRYLKIRCFSIPNDRIGAHVGAVLKQWTPHSAVLSPGIILPAGHRSVYEPAVEMSMRSHDEHPQDTSILLDLGS